RRRRSWERCWRITAATTVSPLPACGRMRLEPRLAARRTGRAGDPLEHRQRRPLLSRRRRRAAPDSAARILARRTRGEARRPRLLGARAVASLAGLAVVRGAPSAIRRAVLLHHQSHPAVLGRALRRTNGPHLRTRNAWPARLA